VAVVIFIVYFILFTSAARADYQNQLLISYEETKTREDSATEITSMNFSHYFKNVETSTGPWLLAPFIQRISSISFAIKDFEYTDNESYIDGRIRTLAVDISSKESPFVFGFISNRAEQHTMGQNSYRADIDNNGLSVGYYTEQYTLVTLGYTASKTVFSDTPYPLQSKARYISLTHVLLLTADSALSLSAQYQQEKFKSATNIKSTNLAANYFVNPQLGIGGAFLIQKSNIDNNNSTTIEINASYFISPKFQIQISHAQLKLDNAYGTESKTTHISGLVYF